MLILHDGNPLTRIRRPWVNWGLIAATVGVFVLQVTGSIDPVSFAFFPQQLFQWLPEPTAGHGLPGLVTHMFLHADILHIGANLLALAVFGNNVEDALGHLRYLLLYLLAGVAAALGEGLLDDPTVPLIGASGAISALMGGYLLLHPRARILILAFNVIPVLAPASLVVGFSIIVNIAMASKFGLLVGDIAPEQARIAWWAHIVGFAAGFLLVPLLKARTVPLFQPPPPMPERALRLLGRVIPTLTWPGDSPLSGGAAAADAAAIPGAERPWVARLQVFGKAAIYVLLILVLMRYL